MVILVAWTSVRVSSQISVRARSFRAIPVVNAENALRMSVSERRAGDERACDDEVFTVRL